jgi:hypothetical protein
MKVRFLLLALLVLAVSAIGVVAQGEDAAALPISVTGEISDDTPFVEYVFEVTETGQTLIVDMSAADPDESLDTLLFLLAEDGTVLAENDDRADGDLSSRIVFPAIDAGMYRVIATRFKVIEGTEEGEFALTIETQTTDTSAVDFNVDDAALQSSNFPAADPQPEGAYTILAYYGADNNLEGDIIEDFKEFEEAGGTTDNVRIVVLLDRSPGFEQYDDDWIGTRLYEVTADTSDGDEITLSSTLLADLGEDVNSGDGELLAQFLVWGINNYPAQNYVVAFASHGVAWSGVVSDYTSDKDDISLPELEEAFRLAQEAAGQERFNLVINDACYMASVEYHNLMSNYFQYSIASPEIVVKPAHDMALFTEQLNAAAIGEFVLPGVAEVAEGEAEAVDEADAEGVTVLEAADPVVQAIAASLSDRYINEDVQLRPGPESAYLTSVVTDLTRFGAVTDAVNDFAAFVREDPATRMPVLRQARDDAYVYSGYAGDDELIDLGSLMSLTIQILDPVENAEFVDKAQTVINALESAVQHTDGGAFVAQNVNTYHNIYFPANASDFEPEYFALGQYPQWGAMLRAYYSSATPVVWDIGEATFNFHDPIAPDLQVTNIIPGGEISTQTSLLIDIEIVGRNISSGTQVVDQLNPDGTRVRLFTERLLVPRTTDDGRQVFINQWNQGVETTPVFWEVRLQQLVGQDNANLENFNLGEEVASLEGNYRVSDDGEWTPVTLLFDRVTGDFSQAISQDPETGSTAAVDIPPGAIFESLTYFVTPDGRTRPQIGNQYIVPDDGLRLEYVPAPSGEYSIGLTIRASGGVEDTATIDITVNNDGVDPDLIGRLNKGLGYVLTTPGDWTFPDFDGANNFFRSLSPDQQANITIFGDLTGASVEAEDNDRALIDAVVAFYELEVDNDLEVREITLPDGEPALEFDYFHTLDGEVFRGRGFTSFLPTVFPPGLIFAAETNGTPDDLDAIYTDLLNNFDRFDPAEVDAADTGNWVIDAAIENTEHPMRLDWALDEISDVTVWSTWRPAEEAPLTFLAEGVFVRDTRFDRPTAAQDLFDREIAPQYQEIEIIANELTYTGAYATWSSIIFQGETDAGETVRGRLYVTLANQQVYAVWAQVPADEDGLLTMNSVIEPIVDGYRIQEQPLEVLGVRPNIVNLGPSQINAADDTEPDLLLRYDGRSVVLYNRLPNNNIDISQLEFVQYETNEVNSGVLHTYPTANFVVGDTSSVRPQDCYQLWANGYFELSADEYPAEICAFRQGFGATRNTFWTSEEPGRTFQVLQNNTPIATCLTVRPIDPANYEAGNPDNEERLCLVDIGE